MRYLRINPGYHYFIIGPSLAHSLISLMIDTDVVPEMSNLIIGCFHKWGYSQLDGL